jgi:hypothetical protein
MPKQNCVCKNRTTQKKDNAILLLHPYLKHIDATRHDRPDGEVRRTSGERRCCERRRRCTREHIRWRCAPGGDEVAPSRNSETATTMCPATDGATPAGALGWGFGVQKWELVHQDVARCQPPAGHERQPTTRAAPLQ